MTGSVVIDVQSAAKTFRGRMVLRGADLTVERNGVYAILGPNGSGKSVLLRLMSLLLRPDSGSVEIADEYLPRGRTFPDRFGILIDRPGYIPGLTGLENLEALARIQRRVDRDDICVWMRRFGLDPALPQRMKAYSQGMIQKVGLIQALMEDQEVLLLDEPFTALDELSVETVTAALRELIGAGRTVVFTTHDKSHITELNAEPYHLIDGAVVRR